MNRRFQPGWLLLLGLLWPLRTDACSCSWAGPLLAVYPRAELVIRAKVLSYHGRSRGIDLAMDVEVLEVLKGTTRASKMRIWGDNGAQCRPYVSGFPLESEWIFAIRTLTGGQGSPGDYMISVCGEYWGRVSNGSVTGRLTAPHPPSVNDKPETMSLDEFRRRVRALG